MGEPEKLNIVSLVTREHGEKFADAWLGDLDGAMTDAFDTADVIKWPDEDEDEETEQQELYYSIQREIVQRVADQLRSTVAEAFVRLANEILARARLG
jgi:adenosylmethionine-8-amino-7-oxononanoate aminotransferase